MGLSYSKTHPRVTKVAPLQSEEAETPSAGHLTFAVPQNPEGENLHLFPRLQGQNRALERQLPPLRENWYGRDSAASRAMYFDIPLEPGETSIIKRHPPRRLQTLQPLDLPQVMTSERLPHQQEARTRHRAKAQMEWKKSLHKEAKLNKQNLRDHKAKKTLQSFPRNDDPSILTILPDETVNRGAGNSQDKEFLEYQARNGYCPRKMGKMEMWFQEQEARGQLFWDSSSSDSEEPRRDEKKRQPLVRTRTERITLVDEFFDQE
ncbi:PREDICTED: uncharacterized protein C14orf105 homolog isoform X3 [Chinchilla lanigera]|uniref:uncharacterized protein C14orf105 homolog isoform X3 n=1 Tax=Chinchilla lanigera TaxID=34839 RepID=UPI00038EFB33|nr:PREDICTED: uncharacterized protein C14orf105 homolog isoform X3 [Chinchilla lanigera]